MPSYYGGFLLDPAANSAEAVHHDPPEPRGVIDHIWIRVGDLPSSRDFYAEVGVAAGFSLGHDGPKRATFRAEGDWASFSLVPGPPTRNLRLVFPGDSAADERDPDGNSVEIAG